MSMLRRSTILIVASLVIVYLCVAEIFSSITNTYRSNESSVSELLTETKLPEGFDYAMQVRKFRFPRDHLPHPNFRSEWWYFTGNLVGDDAREYGFDLTMFRFGLTPKSPSSDSPFRTSQVYLGHFAIADVETQTYLKAEKFSRVLPGITGASGRPVTIKINNWVIQQVDPLRETWALKAATIEFGLDLNLTAARPIILQGDKGLSRKNAEAGNASYYYSIPKLTVAGELNIAKRKIRIGGSAWFDREWSTSALAKDQIGWDWFGLQIADDLELMYYQIRDKFGRASQQSHGVLVTHNGTNQWPLDDEVQLTPLAYWTSPETNARYPIKWQLKVASLALDITVSAKFNDQQWTGTFTYWEGAVSTNGVYGNRSISGHGFLEMTGYDR